VSSKAAGLSSDLRIGISTLKRDLFVNVIQESVTRQSSLSSLSLPIPDMRPRISMYCSLLVSPGFSLEEPLICRATRFTYLVDPMVSFCNPPATTTLGFYHRTWKRLPPPLPSAQTRGHYMHAPAAAFPSQGGALGLFTSRTIVFTPITTLSLGAVPSFCL